MDVSDKTLDISITFYLLLLPQAPASLDVLLLTVPTDFPLELYIALKLPDKSNDSAAESPPAQLVSAPSDYSLLLPDNPVYPVRLQSSILSDADIPHLSPRNVRFLHSHISVLLHLNPQKKS